jgi:hypothetical protein
MWRHPNNISWHFYLPINPLRLVGFDFYLCRLNIFVPFYISMSFGILGRKGFQIGGGVKYDPTATLEFGENDYLLSAHLRVHTLGHDPSVNTEASF